ncbi:MAG: hypothetical protein O3C48_08425 [Crenarchaeota archaeon]|nr:hypothetical protein [Thermoproteota archaeon]
MVKRTRGRSSRIGLLSPNEFELIKISDKKKELMREKQLLEKKNKTSANKRRIKEISKKLTFASKRFSSLEYQLLKRLEHARNDLQLILDSISLQGFRTKHRKLFTPIYLDGVENDSLIRLLNEIGKREFEPYDGTEAIPDYSTWRVFETKYKVRKFWLSTNAIPPNTVRDTTEPTFAISGIKGTWKRFNEVKKSIEIINVREILLKALDLEKRYQGMISSGKLSFIIPRSNDEAKSIGDIRIATVSFENKLKLLTNTIHVRPIS